MKKLNDEVAKGQFIERLLRGDIVVETCPNSGVDYNRQLENRVLEDYKIKFAGSRQAKNILTSYGTKENENFNSYIKDDFERETIEDRYQSLLDYLRKFIVSFDDEDLISNISINVIALEEAITSYYVDTKRLKEFHDIQRTNIAKVYGYMSYWLLKMKPLQVSETIKSVHDEDVNIDGEETRLWKKKLSYINEKFITGFILNGILCEVDVNINEINYECTASFTKLLLYTLKYRDVSAKCLELMISSFLFGFELKENIMNEK